MRLPKIARHDPGRKSRIAIRIKSSLPPHVRNDFEVERAMIGRIAAGE